MEISSGETIFSTAWTGRKKYGHQCKNQNDGAPFAHLPRARLILPFLLLYPMFYRVRGIEKHVAHYHSLEAMARVT
jgi:hypothetical protein